MLFSWRELKTFKTRICDPQESLIKQFIYIGDINMLIGLDEHRRND